MPLSDCPSSKCKMSQRPGKLHMQTRGSKFVKFQEAKIQELSHHVPIGHIPRSLTIHIMGELTRRCFPGDIITVHGIFLPTTNHGFKAIKSGLVADTYLLAMSIIQFKEKYSDYTPPQEIEYKIRDFIENETGDRYTKLAMSIAPEIFGMVDVKKSLLLQMIGGVTKKMDDGMKIRGDLNICMMGDPGVAKSQLLKHISTIAPRAVYTSGKGSSGVGLTAAVLKDPTTNELILEGGSLVMADMGICCIDEFDKMDDADRTAIHEVMEQQTISIAKAGITTTLNARTAILAAANPAWGRYNTKRSPSENINLPAALLSRFDLLFLLLDKPDMAKDRELAMHITHVHRFNQHPELGYTPLEPEFIRGYIALAKKHSPHIPPHLMDFVVTAYIGMREEQENSKEEFTYTTPRTLLAILRLSQALARLRFSDEIAQRDIEEAIRLMYKSKSSLYDERQRKKRTDDVSTVYNIIRSYSMSNNSERIPYDAVLNIALGKGYTEEFFNHVLDTYEKLGEVWEISSDRKEIIIL